MKNGITTRHIFQDDLKPIETWQLLEWCLLQHANEFTLEFMEIQGVPAPNVEKAIITLRKHELPKANREHLTAPTKDQIICDTRLWQLSQDSIKILKEIFPHGLFTHPSYEDAGWFEDPTFYRNGELFMGIVSHEHEGLLNLTFDEANQLQQLGFKSRDKSQWI